MSENNENPIPKSPDQILNDFEAELRSLLTQKLQYIQSEGTVYRAMHEIIQLLEKHKRPDAPAEEHPLDEDEQDTAD